MTNTLINNNAWVIYSHTNKGEMLMWFMTYGYSMALIWKTDKIESREMCCKTTVEWKTSSFFFAAVKGRTAETYA